MCMYVWVYLSIYLFMVKKDNKLEVANSTKNESFIKDLYEIEYVCRSKYMNRYMYMSKYMGICT